MFKEYKSEIHEVFSDPKTSLDSFETTDSIILCQIEDLNDRNTVIGITFCKMFELSQSVPKGSTFC